MRERRYGRPRRTVDRRFAGTAVALVALGALAAGTGMSYAGQNGPGAAVTAAATADCSLVVPPHPLTARGLATPYELVSADGDPGACHEADGGRAAFVQASVVDPATGRVSVYNPLVIDKGARPAVPPVVPALPRNAVVGIWFGFNGDNLTLDDSRGSLAAGNCVNGVTGSIFGQFAYCNARAFFTAATAAIKAGKLKVPPLGTGRDGNPCPTTRDFTVVDQDQSDNVTTAYLVQGTTVAQDTAANRARLPNAIVQVNGSDNLLLVHFVDRALGCSPFQAPDLADNGTLTTSLALDELQAAADQAAPVALVPPNDPMTEAEGHLSVAKLNLYRQGVDMPPVADTRDLAAPYCQQLVELAPARLQRDRDLTRRAASPDPGAANSLFTFLAQRLSGSYGNLGCGRLIKSPDPVRLKVRDGVAVDASFLRPPGTPPSTAPTASTGPTGRPSASPAPTRTPPASTAPSRTPPASPRATGTPRPTRSRTAPAPTAPARDAGTPKASAPSRSAPATATPATRHGTAGAQPTAAAARTAAVQPARTAPRRATPTTRSGAAGTPTAQGSDTAAAGDGTAPDDYSYANDDGVAYPKTRAAIGQGNLAAGPPAAGKSGFFSLAADNPPALIGGGLLLILAGMLIMALITRRRARRPYHR
ncbi:hypothetical protein ACFFWC_24585 [Plantactinospora siamensis]|uniref:LPXTG-motif cell wall anchor domain-containing protein n=1 Tax=Plantactinospora siamensis TaxID=555372 RepID=A0ABV6P6F3_9ACTN